MQIKIAGILDRNEIFSHWKIKERIEGMRVERMACTPQKNAHDP